MTLSVHTKSILSLRQFIIELNLCCSKIFLNIFTKREINLLFILPKAIFIFFFFFRAGN